MVLVLCTLPNVDINMNFCEDTLKGFQIIEWTSVTNRQADTWGKTICLPTLKVGMEGRYIDITKVDIAKSKKGRVVILVHNRSSRPVLHFY